MIVGLAGPAGVGKNTVADFLGYDQDYFAKPIYDMLEAGGFGRPKTQAEKAAIIPGLGISWRTAAQTLGTEWGRYLMHDLWAVLLERRWRTMDPMKKFLVVTDVRFENEAVFVRQRGVLVHVKGREPILDGEQAKHASEAGLKAFPLDLTLYNTSGLLDLHGAVHGLKTHLENLYDVYADQ